VEFPFLLQVDRSIREEQLQGHDDLLRHPNMFTVHNTLAISFRIICLQVLLGSSPLTYENPAEWQAICDVFIRCQESLLADGKHCQRPLQIC